MGGQHICVNKIMDLSAVLFSWTLQTCLDKTDNISGFKNKQTKTTTTTTTPTMTHNVYWRRGQIDKDESEEKGATGRLTVNISGWPVPLLTSEQVLVVLGHNEALPALRWHQLLRMSRLLLRRPLAVLLNQQSVRVSPRICPDHFIIKECFIVFILFLLWSACCTT